MNPPRKLTPPAPTDANATLAPLAVDAQNLGKLLGLSKRTIRAMDSAGKLPRPVRLSSGSIRWVAGEGEQTLCGNDDAGETATLDRLRRAWDGTPEPQRLQFLDELRRQFFRARRAQPQAVARYGNPRRARRRK